MQLTSNRHSFVAYGSHARRKVFLQRGLLTHKGVKRRRNKGGASCVGVAINRKEQLLVPGCIKKMGHQIENWYALSLAECLYELCRFGRIEAIAFELQLTHRNLQSLWHNNDNKGNVLIT